MRKGFIIIALTTLLILTGGSSLFAMDYQHTMKNQAMTFSWSLEGERLHVQISTQTTGWVGIGFNSQEYMLGANIIIGAVKNGKVKIEDHFHEHSNPDCAVFDAEDTKPT